MATPLTEAPPHYCVYRAGQAPITCYRAVRQNPAQLVDFVSFAHLNTSIEWWDHYRAIGVSCFTEQDLAAAIFGPRKGFHFLAELDLSRGDPKMPWAQIGRSEHVTIWAPPPQVLQTVVRYVDIGQGD
jgi:hypothetical protein